MSQRRTLMRWLVLRTSHMLTLQTLQKRLRRRRKKHLQHHQRRRRGRPRLGVRRLHLWRRLGRRSLPGAGGPDAPRGGHEPKAVQGEARKQQHWQHTLRRHLAAPPNGPRLPRYGPRLQGGRRHEAAGEARLRQPSHSGRQRGAARPPRGHDAEEFGQGDNQAPSSRQTGKPAH